MKKIISVVLSVLLILSIFCGCAVTENEYSDNSNNDNTTTKNEYDTWTNPHQFTNEDYEDYEDETSDNYQPINREFSFYNFDNFSFSNGVCILMGIKGYDYENGRAFVYFDANVSGMKLESGFISTIWQQEIDGNTFKYASGRGPYAYSIVNQNGISFAGDGSVLITEQTNLTPDCCVLSATAHFASTGNGLLVPVTCLDFSTYEENYDGGYNNRIFVKE